MRHHVKCALLAGAAWSAISTGALAQSAAPAPQDDTASVEDVVVPAANLLGEEHHGVGIMMSGLDLEVMPR